MERGNWTVYWTEYSQGTYLYGSTVEFLDKHRVHFKNPLMPPGTVIKEWFSHTNYQSSRIEPSLPIIDGESKYRITVDVDTLGGKGCLIKLVFLDKYGREAGDLAVREKTMDFKCPLKTFSYKMQLINGGMAEFTYNSVTIQEIE
ncbi:MAG: accessory Sec system protein Asp3 [Pseudobutyrivibrio sp.]|nr:accessory Sec system protein Asp3 [Pseudobutyrivibrio sp.]